MWLPQALTMGIDYDLFWKLNPRKLEPFLKARELKLKQKNEEMWLQGMYIYNAVSVALANGFRKKGAKIQNYIEEPIKLFEDTPWEKEQKAIREREKAIKFFSNLKVKGG